jgi:pilus assembly protein CpaE
LNLALQLAATHPGRVALFDLDLLFDDAACLLNVSPPTALASVPEVELGSLDRRLIGLLAEHKSQLRVLVAARRPEEGERVSAAHVRAALTALRRQFAITIVDCGGSLGEPTLVPLEVADRVLVVCTPDLACLRDVRDCQRLFAQALHLDRQRVTYCFNHPLPVRGLTHIQFESALEQPLAIEIPHAGDAASRNAVAVGSVVRPNAHSPFIRAIERIAAELRPVDLPGPTRQAGQRGAFGRLSRLLGRHG